MAKSNTTPKMAALTETENKPVAKPKAKAAVAKKAAVKIDAKDLIVASSTEVENLTKPKALKLAPELIEMEGVNDFKLGGVLQRIQEEKWWDGQDWESFKDYIEKGLGLPYRKCMYLVNIYDKLVDAGISWDQVKSIGWSKLRFIVDYLDDTNVDEWVKRADTMNALEIQEYIKTLKSGGSEKNAEVGDEVTTKVSSMVFKVHPDQKETIRTGLDKQKAASGTEYDAVALEQIIISYLEGGTGKPKKAKTTEADVKAYLKKLDAEDAGGLVIAVHPSLGPDEESEEEEDGEEETA